MGRDDLTLEKVDDRHDGEDDPVEFLHDGSLLGSVKVRLPWLVIFEAPHCILFAVRGRLDVVNGFLSHRIVSLGYRGLSLLNEEKGSEQEETLEDETKMGQRSNR